MQGSGTGLILLTGCQSPGGPLQDFIVFRTNFFQLKIEIVVGYVLAVVVIQK
jgi:hypothetical protein